MNSLMEIYNKAQNPVEQELFLERITYYYKEYGDLCFYDAIVAPIDAYDNTEINISDKNKFNVEIYNQWVKNYILYIKNMKESNEFLKNIQNYLESVLPIRTCEEGENIEKELENRGVSKYKWRFGKHISSDGIDINEKQPISNIRHRLYINCKDKDLYRLMSVFKKKCEQKDLRYYFKFLPSKNRSEKIVIYSETEDLLDYVKVLEEIEKENQEIVKDCGKPALLSGKINDWVGIADEPLGRTSYNLARSQMLVSAIEKTLRDGIKEICHKDNKTKNRFIKSRLKRKFAKEIIKDYEIKDIFSKREIIKTVDKFLGERIEEIDELRPDSGGIRSDKITIGKLKGENIELSRRIFGSILPKITQIIEEADKNFYDKLGDNIRNQAKESGYDTKNFCFNGSTKREFMQYDSKIKITGKDIIEDNSAKESAPKGNTPINSSPKNLDDGTGDNGDARM